jgi:hypothetical protein
MRERMTRRAKGLCANFHCTELAVAGFTHCEKCHGAYMASRRVHPEPTTVVVPIAKSPVAIEHIVKDEEFPALVPAVAVSTQIQVRSYLSALTTVQTKTESELIWESIINATKGMSWADMVDEQ